MTGGFETRGKWLLSGIKKGSRTAKIQMNAGKDVDLADFRQLPTSRCTCAHANSCNPLTFFPWGQRAKDQQNNVSILPRFRDQKMEQGVSIQKGILKGDKIRSLLEGGK